MAKLNHVSLSMSRTVAVVGVTLAALLLLALAPPRAHAIANLNSNVIECFRAPCPQPNSHPLVSTRPNYKGWGYVENYRSTNTGPVTAFTWNWARSTWRTSSIPNRALVYVWPYASGWSWAWYRLNWYAVPQYDLHIGFPTPY